MKRLIFLFVGMLFSISISFTQHKGLILFIDHSSSMTTHDFSQTESRILRKLLIDHFKNNGDFVVVSYLFSNTASISNKTEYVFRFKPLSTKGLSSQEAALKKANYQGHKRRYKNTLIERILRNKMTNVPKANQSEILESLVQINRIKDKALQLEIIYLSDMEESSDYRLFREINSVTKAIDCAKKDLKTLISDYHLPTYIIKPTRIKCYFPSNTLDNKNALLYVEAYWREIFQSFFRHSSIQFLTL